MSANEKFNREHNWNDFLDRMLDGQPVMIVYTPRLGRQLQRRAMERALEDRDWFNRRRW